MRLSFVLINLLCLTLASGAAETPPLTHASAQKILESIYQNVSIGAVVHGNHNTARVIAIATRNNAVVKLERDFCFDVEIGWFLYEFENDPAPQTGMKLRIASLSGCKDLKPEPNLLAKDTDDVEKLRSELSTAMDLEDFPRALKILEKLSTAQPLMNFVYGPKKFKLLLAMKFDTAAYNLANELLEKFNDEPVPLNSIASALVDPDNPVEKPDLALAEKAALRARELLTGKNAGEQLGRVLDTLARIAFAKGDSAKAIDYETNAITLTKSEPARAKLQERLEAFKKKK